MRIPYACRPLVGVYKAIAKVTETDAYLNMTEQQFILACLQACGGSANPKAFERIYHEVMKDAGLQPLSTSDKRLEDNGDHSWEYYVDGKVVTEEQYAKGGHASYFTA